MEKKSFFYNVEWTHAAKIRNALIDLKVPFILEQHNEIVTFVFPDMNVRKYNHVFKLFGHAGKPYPF